MRALQQRIVVSGGIAVDIYSEPLSGAQWKDLARACSITGASLGNPFRIDVGGCVVSCDTAEEAVAVAERMASRLPAPVATQAAADALVEREDADVAPRKDPR